MYGMFTFIYHKDHLNVGKYTIHDPMGYTLICLPLPQWQMSQFWLESLIRSKREQKYWW